MIFPSNKRLNYMCLMGTCGLKKSLVGPKFHLEQGLGPTSLSTGENRQVSLTMRIMGPIWTEATWDRKCNKKGN